MVDSPVEEYLARLDRIAPQGYNFGFHIRYSRPKLVRLTYDPAWSEAYSARKYILCDPAVIWPLHNDGACRWSAIDLPDPLGVMAAAAAHGYAFGVAVGCGPIESRSLGSCGRGDREFTDAEIDEIAEIVRSVHALLDGGSELKPHQQAALKADETGMTYDRICAELGISRTALKNRLRGARRALGAETNAEAVRVAIERGLISSTSYTGIARGLPSGES